MTAPEKMPFGEAWMAAYFAEVDRMDPDGLVEWYAENGSFRFANHAPVVGHAAIRKLLRGFYATIGSMSHVRTGSWVDPGGQSGVWEAETIFETLDGRVVTIPAVSVLRLEDALVKDFRFVMDASPLQRNS